MVKGDKMATDKTVNELIVNKLTQAQFDAIPESERSDTELYFITDAENNTSQGIEWKTVLDLPGSHQGWAIPCYIVRGGLPNGTYEFYFSVKQYDSNVSIYVYNTYKVLMNVNSAENVSNASGIFDVVFEESFVDNELSSVNNGNYTLFGLIKKSSNDSILYTLDQPWASYILYYNNSVDVPGCFRLSAIKNVDTGEEYIAEGEILNEGNNSFSITVDGNGQIVKYPLVNLPQAPGDYITSTFGFLEGNSYVGLNVHGVNDSYPIAQLAECSKLEVWCEYTGGGKYHALVENGLSYGAYNIYVYEASDNLSNVKICANKVDGQTYLYFEGLENNGVDFVTVSVALYGARSGCNPSISGLGGSNEEIQSIMKDTVVTEIGGVVTVNNHGIILQYLNESSNNYTQGYFYKACGDIIEIPEECEINQLNYTTSYILSFVEGKSQDFISWFKNYLNVSSLTADDFSGEFTYRCKSDGTVQICYPGAYTNIADDELVSCFIVDNKAGKKTYNFKFKINYTPATKEIENGHWEQVNVQPASEASGDYLPLSGGTMSGDIAFGTDAAIGANYLDGLLIKRYLVGRWIDLYGMNSSTITPMTDATKDLGWSNERWRRLYATKLNNGADLTIPTEGGTLALLEDIPEGTQLEILPTASADNLNKIYQYTGETTADYVNGYFYKSTNDIIQDWFTTGYAQYDTSLTLIITVDQEKFLAQNPVWQDMGEDTKVWRADYDESIGEWYVWTQQPNIYISNADLKNVWGIDVTNAAGDYVPANGDTLMVQLTESESFSWQQIYVQPASGIEDSIGSANALVDTHDTSLNAHENIRGIANGLATLDDNAKVPMSQINDSLLGNVQYQGLYDVSTNTPNLDTVETKGHYYIVSVAGDRFDISFEVGDWIISDGTNWTKVDNTDAVSSVNGRTGNVVITTEDLDLSAYVQKTDYASSKAAGLIRGYNANGFGFVPDTGYPFCETKSLASYNVAGGNLFIGKGTLESIKYSYVRDGIANNTYSLSDTEKEKVRNWIGAGVPTAFETMPDIYASAGKTYQYVGETTEEFTSGYFYKSVSQGISYIASDFNLTFDFDLFWSELETAGITLETLQMTEADKERGGFSIIGTVESETNYRVQDINSVPLDVLLTQSIQATSEYVGANNRWYYKPIETFSWERVDTQPNTNMNIPAHPTTPGSYMLMCTIGEDGTASYSWETVA
jgi:hypothetical protein